MGTIFADFGLTLLGTNPQPTSLRDKHSSTRSLSWFINTLSYLSEGLQEGER